MRILVVDDDEMTVDMICNALEHSGYETEQAYNGRSALEILRSGRCRLVISDWEMPELNGIELCRQVRTGQFPGYIYLILLTSHQRPEDVVEGLSAGADDFVGKPFDPTELSLRVRTGERILALETRDLTIFAMAKLAESRDTDTGTHLERVREYSYILSKEVSSHPDFRDVVTEAYCRLIYLASPLHDIGKIAIPDFVLLKPGRLSDREFEIMKSHTTHGAQTLDAALSEHPGADFLRVARDIAASHHEHFDGKGYPEGLAGDAIPVAGRIVAIADVYDALTSKRVYKDAFTHDVARAIIEEGRGTHFDPRMVDAFLAREEDFIRTSETLVEPALATV